MHTTVNNKKNCNRSGTGTCTSVAQLILKIAIEIAIAIKANFDVMFFIKQMFEFEILITIGPNNF